MTAQVLCKQELCAMFTNIEHILIFETNDISDTIK